MMNITLIPQDAFEALGHILTLVTSTLESDEAALGDKLKAAELYFHFLDKKYQPLDTTPTEPARTESPFATTKGAL